MNDIEALKRELKAVKKEIVSLNAEKLAIQFVLTCLLGKLGDRAPGIRPQILQAFDEAANYAEQFSIVGGKQSGHLPETLRIIEQMRLMLVGRDKPKREV
jgi:hypothetical protein